MANDVRLQFNDGETADRPNQKGRVLFVEAIAKVVPEALEELVTVADIMPGPAHRVRFKLDVPTESAYAEWARRWGFCDNWLRREGRKLVQTWRKYPHTRGRVKIAGLIRVIGECEPDWPSIAFTWAANNESASAFRARAARAIDAYIEQVKALQPPAPRVLNDHHFEMLALQHVGRRSTAQIAGIYHLPPRKVRQRIDEKAAIIGLTLQPRMTGRPRRKGDQRR